MDILDATVRVWTQPSAFYAQLFKGKPNVLAALTHLVLVGLIPVVLSIVFAAVFVGGPWSAVSGGAVLSYYVLGLVYSFIAAGFAHAVIRALGGTGSAGQTYEAVAYGLTPAVLLAFIPYALFLTGLWSLFCVTLGVGRAHRMGEWRSFVAALLGFLLPVGLVFFVSLGTLSLFGGA